jgi:hypothetical protein
MMMSAMKKVIIIMRIMMIMLMVVTMSIESVVSQENHCALCKDSGYAFEAMACDDPHLLGFDGKSFDIYNTGDYLILKESDGFEISFTITNRWGTKSQPFITEIRCRGPGGPWMKATAATATRNLPEATVVVDGVGNVDNGDSYTDPTTSLRVTKSLQGSSIVFVAPRWTLVVQHKIAHVKKDGWHYLNMGISITSLLKTPVTGILGVTYNPDTYARILQDGNNKASSGVADHSSSSRSLLFMKSATPHAMSLHSVHDEIEFVNSIIPAQRKLLKYSANMAPTLLPAPPDVRCCNNGEIYNSTTHICCGQNEGIQNLLHKDHMPCSGSDLTFGR